MENQKIQDQINDLNKKMDQVLDYIHEQKQRNEVVEDLAEDLSIVSRDAYKSTVEELDQQGIEPDIDEVKMLVFKLIRNIDNISSVIDSFESLNDLIKDAGPILNEVGIDAIKKLHEFEKKGYFDYLNELYHLLGKIHEYYSVEDLRELSQNIDRLFNIMKNLSSPQMLTMAEKTTAQPANMKPGEEDKKSTLGLVRNLTNLIHASHWHFRSGCLRQLVTN
ncbi:MAG: hypothetical protein ACOCPM_07420 [Bacteroidales bacterium]